MPHSQVHEYFLAVPDDELFYVLVGLVAPEDGVDRGQDPHSGPKSLVTCLSRAATRVISRVETASVSATSATWMVNITTSLVGVSKEPHMTGPDEPAMNAASYQPSRAWRANL